MKPEDYKNGEFVNNLIKALKAKIKQLLAELNKKPESETTLEDFQNIKKLEGMLRTLDTAGKTINQLILELNTGRKSEVVKSSLMANIQGAAAVINGVESDLVAYEAKANPKPEDDSKPKPDADSDPKKAKFVEQKQLDTVKSKISLEMILALLAFLFGSWIWSLQDWTKAIFVNDKSTEVVYAYAATWWADVLAGLAASLFVIFLSTYFPKSTDTPNNTPESNETAGASEGVRN